MPNTLTHHAFQPFAPLVEPSKFLCDNASCLDRREKIGVHHGAFVYELKWGLVESGGLLIPGVALRTRCKRCGQFHDRVEVPHVALAAPLIIAPP